MYASNVDGYEGLRGIVENPNGAVLSISAVADFGNVKGELYTPPTAVRGLNFGALTA